MRRALGVMVLLLFASAFVPRMATASPIGYGKIIVAGDENWSRVDYAPTLAFATNTAAFFAPSGGGQFLYHIEDSLPWLKGAWFLAGLTAAGNTITNDGGAPDAFAHNLADYDAVFVARQYANDTTVPVAQLIAYVQAGGNVFVSLGSALRNDTGVNEATAWNPFLNAFGMAISPTYHNLVGEIPIVSSDPLMNGVPTLYHNVGSVITLTGSDPNARIIAGHQGMGLFAVYDPTAAPIPEPSTWLLLGTGLAAVAARRRFTKRT